MKFEMSPNIAVATTDPIKAIHFYTEVLGFKNTSGQSDFGDLDASPLRMFVQNDNEVQGVVMELFVDDLDEARLILEENGCRIIRWEGSGKDCYIEDPFGLRFNIWEKK